MQTLENITQRLANGEVCARELLEQCLDKIADPDGEGARAFIHVDAATARSEADAADRYRASGAKQPPLAGIPISVKDLFDVRGQITRAGSRIFAERPPAERDAIVVARLREAGAIIVGRTNMTEFAYSGLGLNPHYGTPKNPYDRTTGRIPGGSSSGAAVSVTDGMAVAAIGTDTGGSCRIPAAFCGLVGFKPTAGRVPKDGTIPLSRTLDSVGPLAASVACAATIDGVLSGDGGAAPKSTPADRLKIGVLSNYVTDHIEDHVADCFSRALAKLSAVGVTLSDFVLPELDCMNDLNANGGISAAEAYTWHRQLLREHESAYDPRVGRRILKGARQSAADYIELMTIRDEFIAQTEETTAPYDAVILPTTPIVAPSLDAFAQDDVYARLNLLALRNPSIVNFLDRCAISLPIAEPGSAPVGLMLMGHRGGDHHLLAVAAAVETVVSARNSL